MFQILIADDERLERLALEKALEEYFPKKCQIFQAEHGTRALELLEEMAETPPNIAILDIKMPGIDGIEVARQLRRRYPLCKIIMLTGYTYFNYAKECISIGVMEFMVKPFRGEELAENIQQAMDLIQEEGENHSPVLEMAECEEDSTLDPPLSCKSWIPFVEKYLHENYAQNLSMEEVASHAGFSAHYFCRRFKQEFSVNFVDYLADVRLKKACELLENPEVTVKEVCFLTGYSEPNYFSRVFKKAYGLTPSQYQKNAIMTK